MRSRRGTARSWDPLWRLPIRPARIVLAIAVLLVSAVLLAPRILEGYGRWLIRPDPPGRADVAVILGGGEGERLGAAIWIWRDGRVRELLISDAGLPVMPADSGRGFLTGGETKRRSAIYYGVPASAIRMIEGAKSTHDEALLVRSYLESRGTRSAIVVTSPFHSRRARATFRQAFRGSPVHVAVEIPPDSLSDHRVARWWTREHETMAVFTETVKILFYWRRYGIPPG